MNIKQNYEMSSKVTEEKMTYLSFVEYPLQK